MSDKPDISLARLEQWVESQMKSRSNKEPDKDEVRKRAIESRNELMGLNKSNGSDTKF